MSWTVTYMRYWKSQAGVSLLFSLFRVLSQFLKIYSVLSRVFLSLLRVLSVSIRNYCCGFGRPHVCPYPSSDLDMCVNVANYNNYLNFKLVGWSLYLCFQLTLCLNHFPSSPCPSEDLGGRLCFFHNFSYSISTSVSNWVCPIMTFPFPHAHHQTFKADYLWLVSMESHLCCR